ncbi:alpha/beta hydrolase fold domain-containing protein [Haloferula sp.]|uniref:alpha/beta hydrolase fold domain-containing protein n=1 Tax=Haloferula sp. TaxID=2497595 RepID=UPI003C790131
MGSGRQAKRGTGGFASLFKRLTSEGFAVAAVDCRLFEQGGTVFVPQCIEDCKDADRYLAKYADELGLAADRFLAMGDSAGGHLALLVALMPPGELPGDPALQAQPYTMKAGCSWHGFTSVQWEELYEKPGDHQNAPAGTVARVVKPGVNDDMRTALGTDEPVDMVKGRLPTASPPQW